MDNHEATGACLRRVIIAAIATGMAAGAAAWALRWLIATMSEIATSTFDDNGGNWQLIATATAGIMIVGWLVRHVFRVPLEHSTRILKEKVAGHEGQLSSHLIAAPVLTSSITLGFGGSAGAEGPVAYTGAAIGSNIARILGLNSRQMFVFMACGAGAGIAAIFKAPLGGMLFTLEVLGMALSMRRITLLATMCLTATMTAYILGGCRLNIDMEVQASALAPALTAAITTGLAIGAYSAYYRYAARHTGGIIGCIRRPVVRNIVSGLTIGLMLFMLPALYGEGYGVLTDMASGHGAATAVKGSLPAMLHGAWTLPVVLCGILAIKPLACADTNSGGGVAGDFTPTLFAGGVAGFAISVCCATAPAIGAVPVTTMMICGMAAAMAGIIRAPMMTVLLVVEMTGGFVLLVPVAAAAFISYVISRMLYRK